VVHEQSGITRDRNYATCDWNGREFTLVDTGGLVPGTKDQMERAIMDQSEFAVHEADLVLLVVDIQSGVHEDDERLARLLQKAGKNVLLAGNKADNETIGLEVHRFVRLGLGEAWPVSAMTGFGTGDLLDELVNRLPVPAEDATPTDAVRVALIGRPNVGKSSFINKLLGQERLVVSDTAGTTRDAVDTPFEFEDRHYVLIDTAGLRRSYKVVENVEFYTNLRAERAIDSAHVVVVLIDAQDGFTSQDQRILAQSVEARRATILAINKWDLIEKDHMTADRMAAAIKEGMALYSFVPLIFVSVLTGQRLTKVLDFVDRVHEQHNRRLPTSELNSFLQKAFGRRKPPARHGKFIQFKYVTQTETAPPTFVFFVNHPELVDKTYIQYLSNQLRAEFGFEGSPIRLKCRRK
jgi:GTP-binding protein